MRAGLPIRQRESASTALVPGGIVKEPYSLATQARVLDHGSMGMRMAADGQADRRPGAGNLRLAHMPFQFLELKGARACTRAQVSRSNGLAHAGLLPAVFVRVGRQRGVGPCPLSSPAHFVPPGNNPPKSNAEFTTGTIYPPSLYSHSLPHRLSHNPPEQTPGRVSTGEGREFEASSDYPQSPTCLPLPSPPLLSSLPLFPLFPSRHHDACSRMGHSARHTPAQQLEMVRR